MHAGSSRGVEHFADHWRDSSTSLDHLGDRVNRIGDSIRSHWADADSNASTRVREHGTWLKDASEWATKFSDSAGDVEH